MQHFLEPRNVGELEPPFGEGCSGSLEAGRFMRMHVRIVNRTVEEVRYTTFGCAPAIAAGSLLSQWAAGRRVEEALALSAEGLEGLLGGLPEERRFCSALAITAFERAVSAALAHPASGVPGP